MCGDKIKYNLTNVRVPSILKDNPQNDSISSSLLEWKLKKKMFSIKILSNS